MTAAIEDGMAASATDRRVAPGDVEGAVDKLADHYEADGDEVMLWLALADRLPHVPRITERGPEMHVQWVETAVPPARRPSGQREYSEDAVRLLRTIKATQRLGFTLAEIEELLELSEHRRGPEELHQRAEAKVAEIDAKIAQLQQMRRALLAVMAAECDSLTDCSCGLGCPLPVLEITGPGGANGDHD